VCFSGAEDTRPYECDALSAYRQLPMVVALPETEAQVAQVLRTCFLLQVPVVARGAGTSLSGGSMPHASGVVLGLAKLNRILALDPVARTARGSSPGCATWPSPRRRRRTALYYAPDPSSQIACSIGGNVAENSGGVHCLKYGLTVHNVLRVRGFTIDGEAVEFGSEALDCPGLDLMALMIGSEGMLAVATEVTVKLVPKPLVARVVMASFDDVVKAGNAVASIIAAGIIPAGLEMMDQKITRAVEPFVKAGYDLDAARPFCWPSPMARPKKSRKKSVGIDEVLRGSGCHRDPRFAVGGRAPALLVGPQECLPGGRARLARLLLHGRHHSAQEPRPDADRHRRDGAQVRSALHECLSCRRRQSASADPVRCQRPAQWERAELFGAEILELCVELGGTVTGEHGVGIEKINSMCVQFSPEERAAFFAVKRAFDEPGLLNPGKGIPTTSRCAEYGKMHIHGGRLPFADIPRF
jgi:glycolate oxidase